MVAFSRPSPGADWPSGRFSRDPRASGLAEAAEGPAFVRRSRHRRALGKMAPADPRLPSGDGGWEGPSPGPAGRPAVDRCGRWGDAGPVASKAERFGGLGPGEGQVGGSASAGGGRSGCPGGRGPMGARATGAGCGGSPVSRAAWLGAA